MSKRRNGEGSIHARGEGWAAYVWVVTPTGKEKRKWIYGQDYEKVHGRWIRLQKKSLDGPVATDEQRIKEYCQYWLDEIVKPNLSPGTYITYRGWVDRQIVPGIGGKKLDRLLVKEAQKWFNKVSVTCQCCFQGKDERRRLRDKRCCSLGKCCNDLYSKESLMGLRRALRAMYSCAIVDELTSKNVGALVKLPKSRKASRSKRRRQRWSTDEARRFLESARDDNDPFYAAYTFILVLGFRKGEALGVDEDEIDLEDAELDLAFQLQRLGKTLVRRETKTAESEDVVPLPGIVLAAIKHRLEQKDQEATVAGDAWQGSTLVTTTPLGTPKEPRNFNRAWDERCDRAGVRRITPRDARRTCGSILADLDVHPRVAMQILRHAKFAMTMEIYSQPSSEATRKAIQRLGEALES